MSVVYLFNARALIKKGSLCGKKHVTLKINDCLIEVVWSQSFVLPKILLTFLRCFFSNTTLPTYYIHRIYG